MFHLTYHPFISPKNKLRGKKRYFRTILQKAESFSIAPQENDWWESWHYHADWNGWGNLGWKYRREYLKALLIVFKKICDVRKQFSIPFQTWLQFDGKNACYDATFLNSPNQHQDFPFPWRPTDCQWSNSELTPDLEMLIPNIPIRIGHLVYSDYLRRPIKNTVIYSPEVGVPLE